jgi:hypothetical protein
MDDVQTCDSYIDIPSWQTYISRNFVDFIAPSALCFIYNYPVMPLTLNYHDAQCILCSS